MKAAAKELTSARKGAAAKTDLSQGAGILDDSRRKARYGVAFLRAVCAQAGVPMQETSPDEDVFAVDCTADFAEGPVFVQVKCTSTLAIAGASASVALEDKWKERWARRLNPVYLLLVLVPSDVETWLEHQEKGTFHATAAYWVRVDGSEGSSVKVPKAQRLTAATLGLWRAELLAPYGGAA